MNPNSITLRFLETIYISSFILSESGSVRR